MRYVLITMFALSRVMDFLSTYATFHRFPSLGHEVEGNPISHFALQYGGWTGMALYGVVIDTIAVGILLYCYQKKPKTGLIGFITICVISNLVVIHNLFLLCTA